jgi:two-component system, response regulator PdtaR
VVAETDTAQAGIDAVVRERPDVALISVGLPDGDGIEAAAEIECRYPCPVVVLTSHADREVIDRARRAGAMAYLVKPLRPEELAPAVELAIARFAELERAGREAAALRRALEDRKTIERAKGSSWTGSASPRRSRFAFSRSPRWTVASRSSAWPSA